MKKIKKYIIVGLFISLVSLTAIYFIIELINNQPSISSDNNIEVQVEIPVKTSYMYADNKLLAGVEYYYDTKIIILNKVNHTLENISIKISLSNIVQINAEDYSPSDLNISDNTLSLIRNILLSNSSIIIKFKIKPPSSVPYSLTESININIDYTKNSENINFNYIHYYFIDPQPSWIIYITIIIGILILITTILIAKKTNMLEKYTTIDLINITVLASLGAIVFKWIWQIFNDFLWIFGGLLLTIPAAVLMIIAIYLVKKPGTTTLFFLIWELVNFFVWGSNIMSWLGWYLIEGVIIDILTVLFKDYAERSITASLYGLTRSFIAYWTTYFWFSPAIWKIYYAPWYAWLQIIIGSIGGIIGGILGYYLAKKLEKAIIIY